MVPEPNCAVVAVVALDGAPPPLDCEIAPEPKGAVVTVWPLGPRVMEPFPKLEVVKVLPSEERVIQPLPNWDVW